MMPSFSSDGDGQGTSSLTLKSGMPFKNTGVGKRNIRMKKKKKGAITANFFGTKYQIVRLAIMEAGFARAREEDDTANLIWNDTAVQQERIADLRNYQRINHFPGMGEICRKDCLARNMAKMLKTQSQEYCFTPRTWIFPAEYTQFQTCVKELRKKRRQKTFIVKPANGAMGHGISLIRSGEKLQAQEHLIVQEYLDKPFLLEGYKFDLRIYILVTSCDPLRIFLYNDGLVRMGTEKYHAPTESNLSQLFMHLTNYSVNKHNENFERDEQADRGSKRSIQWFTEFLRTNDYDVAKFWNDVSDLVVKTLIVAEPHILHAYRMCRPGQHPGSNSVCFEVLGFDIILDRKLKPWLLEINRAPSFGTDQKIDFEVKKGVLVHALKLLNIRTSDRRKNLVQQKAEAQRRLYGHGSVKRLSAGSSEWEKQRHSLERRREELKERLVQVRKRISREAHENQNLGNYRRIYPPDDKQLLEKYESLICVAFQTFLAGRAASLQKELSNPLNHMKEEDILDLLEQCEVDDEKLLGKSPRQRGPKQLFSMPETTEPTSRKYDDSSSSGNSSCSSDTDTEDEQLRDEKIIYVRKGRKYESPERSGRIQSKPPTKSTKPPPSVLPTTSLPIRRSISCPRSISTSATHLHSRVAGPRSTSAKPTVPSSTCHSDARPQLLNRNMTAQRIPHATSLGTIHSAPRVSILNFRTKEQGEEMTKEMLVALNAMRIKFPGKSNEEAEVLLDEILDNWKYHKPKVASYWLVKLDSTKQRKVLDIVRTNIRSIFQRVWKVHDIESLRLYRIFNRVFNRLLWSRGQGLWNCFSNSGNSWETMFNRSAERSTSQELQCCQRLVQLCKDCLLVVYRYAADSKGSFSGFSHEWEDNRYLPPPGYQLTMKTLPTGFSRSSTGMPRSRSLYARRLNQY
ncbi:tubulin polyglutamylase TTLL7 [Scyliorhinus canicula]|uniref:tubulin polyglutamylase TTLL7 n=1 Tax=Scyliorhinus canicula TaxID=7830 RepID=UPI0018F63FBD|nr:tubulin polyglutamylase TTLL7 [Scyliorhinus canicula]XP_038649600.1 tubulin polyglutamylase TTLL7 [Scyliorhinus canicula]XP_038649601.1 tubulin polyglutamylase TTLL7 [Scyliorhinus canicula]XP_038649602.1 tubulin polyglutamylase TTLL7 [Scyliorhinus canicula]XP_038649604.1 tubulin polyglutamylase TTLL7 [Scyliorhinus canicula]XP_038649605.1 tubulin polyglutamylase TTLL7 [Scyliorhinus canicula]XP_038649606.1 tubulin polyglutamylase TTLL7 [Scyliorhinus canicula]XP_038649607.1 tubulin polygluta